MKILKLSASWCKPCKAYAPIFDKWSEANPEINVDSWDIESTIIEKSWGIQSIPTTIILDDDDKMIKKHVGPMTPKELDEFSKLNKSE